MPRRVLFVIPPPLGDLAANHEGAAGMGALRPVSNDFVYPPHTVAVCASAARAGGWSPLVVDGAGSTTAGLASSLPATSADVLAIFVSAATFDADLTFARILTRKLPARGAGRPSVLLFGQSAGFARGWEDAADALLAGEPDLAIAAALDGVNGGASGILAASDLMPSAYSPAGLMRDLDAGPFAAWDLVSWQSCGMVSLLSSRGCPAGCRYCAYILAQGNLFRSQTVERTVAEWSWVAEEVRPPSLVVRDPVFAHDRSRVASICDSLAGRNTRLKWACESRPEHFDRELIRGMAAAGCSAIKIGMETGDPELLARIGRVKTPGEAGAYLEQVGRVSRWCEEAGVRCRIFLMAGLPGQMPASHEATLAALRRVAPTATLHPNVYRAYDGVALEGHNQPVAPGMLEAVRSANRPAPPLLKRAVRFARRRLGRQAVPTASSAPQTSEVSAEREFQTSEVSRAGQYLLTGSRVFLTGGSGFVGGYVARALVDAGAEVVALLRPESPPGALAGLPLQIVRGDLTLPSSYSPALKGCRFCFHVAALYAQPERAVEMYAINARGTGALLAACADAGVARFIHTSTIGTVGRPEAAGALPDERTPFATWEQASHYVRSKRIGELIAQAWSGEGLDVVIVKPAAPVGAGDGGRGREPSATGRRIVAALQGRPFGYPPGGINHAPVTDIAAGHLLAAEHGRCGETYILGHAKGNLDRAAFLRLIPGAAAVDDRRQGSAGPDALTANPLRAILELGMPQSDLAAAFAQAAAWYAAELLEAQEHAVVR